MLRKTQNLGPSTLLRTRFKTEIRNKGVRKNCRNLQARLRLQLHASHPYDSAVDFEDRPERAVGTRNSQTFQHFLHFA